MTTCRLLGKAAALVNMLCFLNASLGVNVVMALTYLFVRPFSSATVRRLVRKGSSRETREEGELVPTYGFGDFSA